MRSQVEILTEMCKFEIFHVKKPPTIWRSVNEELSDKCMAKTVKNGRGSLMVWGCMATSGIGNLILIESTMKKEDAAYLYFEGKSNQTHDFRKKKKKKI